MNIPDFLEFPQPYADVAVTFDNRSSTVRIHYKTLKIMGCPKYFRMMIMKASGDVVLENVIQSIRLSRFLIRFIRKGARMS